MVTAPEAEAGSCVGPCVPGEARPGAVAQQPALAGRSRQSCARAGPGARGHRGGDTPGAYRAPLRASPTALPRCKLCPGVFSTCKSLQQALEWLQLQLKVCSLGTVPALRALTLAVVTLQ